MCALGWVKCRAQIQTMGHHTWLHATSFHFLYFPFLSLSLGAAFGAVKIAVSPVPLYTKKAALCSQTLLYQALHCMHDEMEMRPIGPITTDEHHAKEGFGKMNCRANRFLTLHACQPVVGDSNMNLSLPIGAL